jgi:hypothetical protein
MVLISRPISWVIKPNFLPLATVPFSVSRSNPGDLLNAPFLQLCLVFLNNRLTLVQNDFHLHLLLTHQ